ncbi:hypothetical protein DVH05_016910 [Phytophthora capsici]|nr:hypothetical protein DVH05_007538 [Phytophthora capsici]KAG1709896.1 hypothetical protein DVH05_016910 [Phytophthora capsici]
MSSRKRLAAVFAEEKNEEGQEQNLKRQKLANDRSEETSPDLTIKTANNPKATTEESAFPVNFKAKMPDVPLADDYRGGEFFFVRECYAGYYSKVEALLVEKKKQCVTVTGTPGTL